MYVVSLSFDSLPCGKITSRSPSSSDFKRKQVEAEMPREEEGVSLNKKISSLYLSNASFIFIGGCCRGFCQPLHCVMERARRVGMQQPFCTF